MFKLLVAVSIVFVAQSQNGIAKLQFMERNLINIRYDYVQESRASVDALHEVVFAVKQNNLDILSNVLMEVSAPHHSKFGKHLSRAEVGALTKNSEGETVIENYLNENNIEIVKKTPYGEYITARATIGVFETLFDATFFSFKHVNNLRKPIIRALHYSMNSTLIPHVVAIFNTVQLPNQLNPKLPMTEVPINELGQSGFVNPALINSFYGIGSNTGNTEGSQSVFATIGQNYSPNDLSQFQQQFGLPIQSVATNIGGNNDDSACASSVSDCSEANRKFKIYGLIRFDLI